MNTAKINEIIADMARAAESGDAERLKDLAIEMFAELDK